MSGMAPQLSRRVRSIRHRRNAPDEPDDRRRPRRAVLGACATLSAVVTLVCASVLLFTAQETRRAHRVQSSTLGGDSLLQSHSPSSQRTLPAERTPATLLHVVLATDEEAPFGLLGVINSTAIHCSTPRALRFHLIVPNERRASLRSTLSSFWPALSFRTYSLDTNGVRAKITRHLRRTEREPVFLSPFRLALVYLPHILPNLRRVLWLHTDILVFGDVAELFLEPQLRDSPVAAVQDCSTPLSAIVDTSRVSSTPLSPSGCSFDPSLMMLDLHQWILLDIPSRIEYWMDVNGRGGEAIYHHDAPFPPILLGLLSLYAHLPSEWNVGNAGRRRLREEELVYWRSHWAVRGVAFGARAQGPVLIITGGGGAGPRAKALHFHGRLKPWLLGPKQGAEPICRELEGGKGGSGSGLRLSQLAGAAADLALVDLPCRSIWEAYAGAAVAQVGWQRRGPSTAAAASAVTAMMEAKVEPADQPPLAEIEADDVLDSSSSLVKGGSALSSTTHIAFVCTEATPYGLIAAINSTLAYAAARPGRKLVAGIRFHVLVPATLQATLARKLALIFPAAVRLSISTPPADKLSKLATKLSSVGITASPYDWPLLWIHQALPSEIRRVVLLPSDILVRFDLHELAAAALHGKVVAGFEDCSTTFESLFNVHHTLFKEHHGRASCSIDPDILLIDLRAWKRDDAPQRLLETVGFQRRNENLFRQPLAALNPAVTAQLLLDKRALRLPSRWVARGLARDAWSYSEAEYWHRYWGLQGVTFPFSTKPVRAPHAALSPKREAGDALLLRFSGGPMKPWLKRCGGTTAAGVPLCGKSNFDCAKLWLKQVSEEAMRTLEAQDTAASNALLTSLAAVDVLGARRACVSDTALKARLAEREALVFDADAAFEPKSMSHTAVVNTRGKDSKEKSTHGSATGAGSSLSASAGSHGAPHKSAHASLHRYGTAASRGSSSGSSQSSSATSSMAVASGSSPSASRSSKASAAARVSGSQGSGGGSNRANAEGSKEARKSNTAKKNSVVGSESRRSTKH